MTISLLEIDSLTVRAICNLSPKPEQVAFISSNALSIAEAHYDKTAWLRGVFLTDNPKRPVPVGFVLMSLEPDEGVYHLSRFMISKEYQGKGFGREAMQAVVEYVRQESTKAGVPMRFTLTIMPANKGAKKFAAKCGWKESGIMVDGEDELRYKF